MSTMQIHETGYFAQVEVPAEPYMIALPNNASKQSSIDSPKRILETGGLSKQKMWARRVEVDLLSWLAQIVFTYLIDVPWKKFKAGSNKTCSPRLGSPSFSDGHIARLPNSYQTINSICF